jgi:nitrite reductase/ring-hydroxylating ferredoxin subunit
MVEINRIGELGDGEMKEVIVQGNSILLARAGNKYCATEGRCPHMGGRLADGTLQGTVLTLSRGT